MNIQHPTFNIQRSMSALACIGASLGGLGCRLLLRGEAALKKEVHRAVDGDAGGAVLFRAVGVEALVVLDAEELLVFAGGADVVAGDALEARPGGAGVDLIHLRSLSVLVEFVLGALV